jgi:hypothetical protein
VMVAIGEFGKIAKLVDVRLAEDLTGAADAPFADGSERAEQRSGRAVGRKRDPHEGFQHGPQALRHFAVDRTGSVDELTDQRVAPIMLGDEVAVDVPSLNVRAFALADKLECSAKCGVGTLPKGRREMACCATE